MTKQQEYSDYKSVWQNKPGDVLKIELKQVEKWGPTLDKYVQKDSLKSNDKRMILNSILKDRSEK